MDHCILLLKRLTNHMHFLTKRLQTLLKDQLDRPKVTCSFKNGYIIPISSYLISHFNNFQAINIRRNSANLADFTPLQLSDKIRRLVNNKKGKIILKSKRRNLYKFQGPNGGKIEKE